MLEESPESEGERSWLPTVDNHEMEEAFVMETEPPGIDRNEDGMLRASEPKVKAVNHKSVDIEQSVQAKHQ